MTYLLKNVLVIDIFKNNYLKEEETKSCKSRKKLKQKIQLDLTQEAETNISLSYKVDFICPCADISEVKRTFTRLKNRRRTLRNNYNRLQG